MPRYLILKTLFRKTMPITAAVLAVLVTMPVRATTVPFVETFDTDSANWFIDNAGTMPVGFSPAEGGFATMTFNFKDSVSSPTGGAVFFRGHDDFNSSADAFVGDWTAAGVTELSFLVRHNATVTDTPVALSFFTRVSASANAPGFIAINPVPVLPNVWTPIVIPIPNPGLIGEGPPGTVDFVLGNVGNIQIAAFVPQALELFDQDFQFDLDNVAITPEPASLLLLAGGAMVMVRRRALRRSAP